MKIIHTGDVHLGAAFDNLPKEKARIRRVELVDGFTRLCSYAKETGVSAVLIAGDLFDENQTPSYVKKQAFQAIENAKPVRFFYVSGNHDDEFSESGLPSNLFLFSQNHAWQSYDLGNGVVISGLDTKNLSVQTLSSLQLYPDAFNVVLLHGDVQGGGREAIDLRLLQNKNVDYLALGHIHKPDLERCRLDARATYRYCGCLEGRGFDECGEKGAVLLEIASDSSIKQEFLPIARRTLHRLPVNVTPEDDARAIELRMQDMVGPVPAQDMVLVELQGERLPECEVDTGRLLLWLKERFFAAKLEDRTTLSLRPEDYMYDASLKGEFIRTVMASKLSSAERDRVILCGLRALRGEEAEL